MTQTTTTTYHYEIHCCLIKRTYDYKEPYASLIIKLKRDVMNYEKITNWYHELRLFERK